MRLQKAVTNLRDGLFILSVAVVAGGCAGLPTETAQEITQQKTKAVAELTDTPFHPQKAYQCGPAALATVLNNSDIKISPNELVNSIYIPRRQGSLQIEIVATTRAHDRLPYILDPRLDHVLAEIDAGRPVLVLQNLGLSWIPRWHYAVAIGYNKHKQVIVLRSGIIERKRTSFKLFDRTWRRSGRWAMVVLKPDELPTNANEDKYLRTLLPFEHVRRWDVTVQAYTAAANKWPTSLGAHIGSGNSHYALKNYSEAIFYYRKALAIDPNHAPAHNNIANALLEKGKIKEAKKHARKAIKLGGPHLATYRQTLDIIRRKRFMAGD